MDFSIRLSWYKSFNESTWKHLSGLLVQNEKQVNNLSTTSFLDPVCCKNCKQNHRVHQTHSSMWQEKCKTLEVEKLCFPLVWKFLKTVIQRWLSISVIAFNYGGLYNSSFVMTGLTVILQSVFSHLRSNGTDSAVQPLISWNVLSSTVLSSGFQELVMTLQLHLFLCCYLRYYESAFTEDCIWLLWVWHFNDILIPLIIAPQIVYINGIISAY